MNRDSERRKWPRAWPRWMVGSLVVALLATQLAPLKTQAQSGDGHSIYLPAVADGTVPEVSAEDQGVSSGDLPAVDGEAVEMAAAGEEESEGLVQAAQAGSRVVYTVGGTNLTTQYCSTVTMPSFLLDYDGGRIRMIMQHESDSTDQVRIIELFVGHEWTSNAYGARGRYPGRYGWARQSGGGEYAWILGDSRQHTLANPWNWATIHDFWPGRRTVLGGNNIAICSHPHVTTRFIFYDQ